MQRKSATNRSPRVAVKPTAKRKPAKKAPVVAGVDSPTEAKEYRYTFVYPGERVERFGPLSGDALEGAIAKGMPISFRDPNGNWVVMSVRSLNYLIVEVVTDAMRSAQAK